MPEAQSHHALRKRQGPLDTALPLHHLLLGAAVIGPSVLYGLLFLTFILTECNTHK